MLPSIRVRFLFIKIICSPPAFNGNIKYSQCQTKLLELTGGERSECDSLCFAVYFGQLYFIYKQLKGGVHWTTSEPHLSEVP